MFFKIPGAILHIADSLESYKKMKDTLIVASVTVQLTGVIDSFGLPVRDVA